MLRRPLVTRLRLVHVLAFALRGPVRHPLDDATREDGRRRRERQVGADRERERRDPAELHRDGDEYAHEDELPVEVEREEALDERRHQGALRGGELLGADRVLDPLGLHLGGGVVEHLHRDADDGRRRHAPDDESELLVARRRADEESRLEVLGGRAGVRGRDAHHAADAERHRLVDVLRPADADEHAARR
ncbi:MAG TPA: hypothetical protein PKW35_19880, partial [Nannocystaceae bacterium]|nr:hypothetical protein [Nannocystaceae bacterium]